MRYIPNMVVALLFTATIISLFYLVPIEEHERDMVTIRGKVYYIDVDSKGHEWISYDTPFSSTLLHYPSCKRCSTGR